MVRPIKYKAEDILQILTKDYQSTNQIASKGKLAGLYNRWESYKLALEDLKSKGLVSSVEIPKGNSVQVLWRKK